MTLVCNTGVVVNVREIVAALRAAWWLPLLGLVLAAPVALVRGLHSQPWYASHMSFFIFHAGAETTGRSGRQQRVPEAVRAEREEEAS